jgi:hypothetical protein
LLVDSGIMKRTVVSCYLRGISAVLSTGLLLACAFPAADRQSLPEIQAREPVLFERQATWGYLPDGHRGIARGVVVWEGTGNLVLTPTTLYILYGNKMSRTISYAAVTGAEVGPVQDWEHPPFGTPTALDDMLIVRTVDDVFRARDRTNDCDEGCVFHLIDPDKVRGALGLLRPKTERTDTEAANRALAIIDKHRGRVDAFGRLDGERRAALVTRLRPRQVNWIWWRYNERENARPNPAVEKQIEERLRRLTPSLSHVFDQGALAALDAAFRGEKSSQDFTFLPLEAAESHWDGRWLGYSDAEMLSRTRPDLNRLLLVELITMTFYPRNMAIRDSEPVEASYRIHVDFFDLHPARPGAAFWYEHTVTRPMRDWLAGGESLIEADLAEALGIVAERTRLLLAASPTG